MVKKFWNQPGLIFSIGKAFFFLVLLILANILFDHWFTRFDFTQEKRFTLSPTSIKILERIHSPIHIQVFLEGDFPAPFKRLRKETQELLNEFSAYAHGEIQVDFIDPLAGAQGNPTDFRDSLNTLGIQALSVQMKTREGSVQKDIFPGAILSTGGRVLGISLLQNQNQMGSGGAEALVNQSVEGLEYVLINGIKKIYDADPPSIGLLSGNGEVFGPGISDLIKTLRTTYRVGKVDLNLFPLDSLVKINLLILIKPEQRFSEPEKYKLDQYIMHGGKVLGFVDNVHAELDSMGKNGTTLGMAQDLNLDDLFFRLGLRMNYNLVQDLNSAPIPVLSGAEGSGSGQNLEPWVYYPLVMPAGNHPIVRNLDPVRLQFAGSLDTLGIKEVKKTFLLTTSPYSRSSPVPVLIQLSQVSDPVDKQELYKGGKVNVGVLLEGNFKSSFQNRDRQGLDSSLPFLAQGSKTALIFVSDGDLPLNQVNSLEKTIYPLGFDKYTSQVFGNKVFVQNAVDYLTDPEGLVLLRSKEVRLRLLNKPLVETSKNLESLGNFLFPILWVLVSGLGFAWFRSYRYSKAVLDKRNQEV
jgi:ABC-2 type transport system permease protein